PSPASGGRSRWWRFNRRMKGREVAFQQAAAGAGVRRTRRPALGGPSLRSCQPRSVAGGFLGFRGGVLHRAGSVGSGFAGGVGGLVRGLLGLGGSLIHGGVGLGGRFLGGGFELGSRPLGLGSGFGRGPFGGVGSRGGVLPGAVG